LNVPRGAQRIRTGTLPILKLDEKSTPCLGLLYAQTDRYIERERERERDRNNYCGIIIGIFFLILLRRRETVHLFHRSIPSNSAL